MKNNFATGRRLEFYQTPYCHEPESFVTYDTLTKTLFSSDLFGSFDHQWSLFLELNSECCKCEDSTLCLPSLKKCPIMGIKKFHQKIMTSNLALGNALNVIESLDVQRIASQHGSIISTKEDVETIIRHLRSIKNVGIDYLLSEGSNE